MKSEPRLARYLDVAAPATRDESLNTTLTNEKMQPDEVKEAIVLNTTRIMHS